METETRERAAYNIGYIEGRASCYNEIMETISIMRMGINQGYNYSVRTLDILIERISNEVIV